MWRKLFLNKNYLRVIPNVIKFLFFDGFDNILDKNLILVEDIRILDIIFFSYAITKFRMGFPTKMFVFGATLSCFVHFFASVIHIYFYISIWNEIIKQKKHWIWRIINLFVWKWIWRICESYIFRSIITMCIFRKHVKPHYQFSMKTDASLMELKT